MQKNEIKSVIGVIFINEKTEVLLVKRRDVPVWVLPGGGVDPHESPEDAVIREILEETGFTVKINRCIALYTPVNKLTKTTLVYECNIVSGKPTPSDETSSVAFFPLNHLPEQIPPPFTDWIQDARAENPFFQKELSHITYSLLFRHFLSHPLFVIRFIFARIQSLFRRSNLQ